MPRKPSSNSKPADPEEYKRFLETAKEAEASKDPEDLKRAIKKIAHLPRVARSGDA